MKKLSTEQKPGQLRLWGKIKGVNADYYIAEGTLEAGEEGGSAAEDVEPRGTGLNKFVYWATNSPVQGWTQLPDIRPQDILNARGIRHTFSGDLDSSINTCPFYHDKEKQYLRA
jgi:hypothetical protein